MVGALRFELRTPCSQRGYPIFAASPRVIFLCHLHEGEGFIAFSKNGANNKILICAAAARDSASLYSLIFGFGRLEPVCVFYLQCLFKLFPINRRLDLSFLPMEEDDSDFLQMVTIVFDE